MDVGIGLAAAMTGSNMVRILYWSRRDMLGCVRAYVIMCAVELKI